MHSDSGRVCAVPRQHPHGVIEQPGQDPRPGPPPLGAQRAAAVGDALKDVASWAQPPRLHAADLHPLDTGSDERTHTAIDVASTAERKSTSNTG